MYCINQIWITLQGKICSFTVLNFYLGIKIQSNEFRVHIFQFFQPKVYLSCGTYRRFMCLEREMKYDWKTGHKITGNKEMRVAMKQKETLNGFQAWFRTMLKIICNENLYTRLVYLMRYTWHWILHFQLIFLYCTN